MSDRSSGGTYRADAVDTQLQRRGWIPLPTRGSHRTYRHPAYRAKLRLAFHGNRLEGWQMRDLQRALRRVGQTAMDECDATDATDATDASEA